MIRKDTLDTEALELLGLTKKDLDIYQSLLRLGSAPLRQVAEEASLNRGTTYDALKRLIELGLVSYVDAKTHRYFTAEHPEQLRGLATRREVALREARLAIDEAIPKLEDLRGESEYRPAVRYYEGESGVRSLLEDVLKTTERADVREYRVYSSAGIRDRIAEAWPSFTKERIKRGIRVKAIATDKGGGTAGLDERKWLRNDANSPTYIFIYPSKTAYVSQDAKKNLFGVIIEDAAIATTQTVIFESLWRSLAE